MVSQEVINEIKSHIDKESERCIRYSQELFDVKDRPKILVEESPIYTTDNDSHLSGRALSCLRIDEVIVNPTGVVNSVNLKNHYGYPCTLRESAIDHLSQEVGHFMHRTQIKDEFDELADVETFKKDFYNTIVKRGILEAVSFYNKVNTLSQYNLKDRYFEDKAIYDSVLLSAITRNLKILHSHKSGRNVLSTEELNLTVAENIGYESLFLGREIFEWELRNAGVKEFRDFTRKHLNSFEKEKTEGYIVYLKANLGELKS